MKCKEELSWILDKGESIWDGFDDKIRENKDFVHGLGLKCDAVGWCQIDLSDPRTEMILDEIAHFCRNKGYTARCLYTRKYYDLSTDWYQLVPTPFKYETPSNRMEIHSDCAELVTIWDIQAYREMKIAPKSWGLTLYVPERFRNFCMENKLDSFDFCWARDKGRYRAEQYFQAYGKHLIPKVAVDFELDKSNSSGIEAAGGWLPRIAEVFHKIQMINLPDCYMAQDLPDKGIVCAYIPETHSCAGRNTFLIHKDIALELLRQKILPQSALQPAPVVNELPGGYVWKETQYHPRPTSIFAAKMLAEYELLKQKPRPIRKASEKEALKLLRSAKKERKDDFQKALQKATVPGLEGTTYQSMIPYYLVSNGGFLSDEYELLPYDRALIKNEEFHRNLEAEELLEEKPDGVVVAVCPDGDVVLLCTNGTLIQFSHEAPEEVDQWPSLAQFVVDAINE